jgi:hypothetical protein
MAFTLGCDPELVCRKEGRFVQAHNYFKANSSFGLDGCESIAEVRPGYSESPIDLTAKIRTCLEYGHEKADELEFYAGHFVDDFALGGHLHLSVSPEGKLISSLDTVLGSLSACIDDRDQKRKRERSGYGKQSAYRKKSYGFEYRTPGSWLLSPTVTLCTLTLAKLTVLGVLEDDLDFPQLKAHQRSASFLKNFKNMIHTIPDDCREGLKELETLIKMPLNWSQNILPNWGIV